MFCDDMELPWWLSGKKNLPIVQETQETWVHSLGWEDPLEEGMAPYSSLLAWRIPMDRGAWRAAARGVAESDMTECGEMTRARRAVSDG